MSNSTKTQEVGTVEIRPGEFEELHPQLVQRCSENMNTAGFFHSLGRAMRGDNVNNQYLKANGAIQSTKNED